MLIEFSVKNYRSILERQTLSMAASRYFKEMYLTNTFEAGATESLPRLLRTCAIYGPNASGKSNMVRALGFMRNLVINSAKDSQANEGIDVQPFKLTAASRTSDSEFEIIFIEDGVRYQYGFCCNEKQITEEWLLVYPEGRMRRWFQRVFDPESSQDQYRFSPLFHGGRKRQDWKDQTRPNALFLSTALQLNNEQLKPVLAWFQKRLKVIGLNHGLMSDYTVNRCKEEVQKKRTLEFLNEADLSIADIHIKTQPFSPDALPKNLSVALREEISEQMKGKEVFDVKFLRKDVENDEPIEFSPEEESEGTLALFAFAGPWLDLIDNERVLVVDELNASLHPLIVHHLLKRLYINNCKAQLIFNTHDTTILSQKILRRDQIWLMEKDKKNSTRIYPLSDFSPRENEAIERGYLNGRYGGIPFLKDLDFYGNR